MIKVAIIGTGAISTSHIDAFLAFQDQCKIVALCDIYSEKAQKQAKDFDLDVEIYNEYKDVMARNDIDLVSICTPPYTHADITIEALEQGKHVIVEKPMASSLEECDAMNAAAEQSGKILSVIAQNRFTSPMMKLKSVLDSKLMGKILHTQVDSFWWRGYSYYDLWWRGLWEKEGGGCTLNHAVHHIDIFRWMNGMPAEVTAVMSNVAHDNAEVEDISITIGRYVNGSLAQITSSVVHHGEEQQLIFQGEFARVSVPWKVTASKPQENGFPEINEELESKIQQEYDLQPNLQYEGHAGQIQDVLLAIEGKKDVLVTGKDGRETLELITAIYQSSSLGESVALPLGKNSPFYSREGVLKNATYFYEKKKSIDNFATNEITTGGKYE
ncbi:Gfo/Idh/MocA family protein [Halalkalibacter hemicellulosilyticus]|uniref:Oxidoreductase n=1 Tax=Halalkalibacter hemicellulosilyticusJCM 9152 TaxID=1236971 RepID=W4QC02_9BACI|nr:Gfo/Idh/MocA family oxidoreductase [Halalkalibacter hemicellulosilyticus]GAE29467.1 oxidoreductase [Halalkalibacter hemicellulosilyticusJCM 9152]